MTEELIFAGILLLSQASPGPDQAFVTRSTLAYGFGAGVQTQIEEGQTLTYGEDGSMIVSGFDTPMPNLQYIVGTVSDHILTVNGEEISLRDLCGRNSLVRFVYEAPWPRR